MTARGRLGTDWMIIVCCGTLAPRKGHPKMKIRSRRIATALPVLGALMSFASPTRAQLASAVPGDVPLSLDHYVPVKSNLKGFEGEAIQIYLRERVLPNIATRGAASRG